MEIKENQKNIEEFGVLYDNVGWGRYDDATATAALQGTLYSVSLYEAGCIIGYGRLVGDGAAFVYLQDVMVRSDWQGKGIGTRVMELLLRKIDDYRQLNPYIRVYLGASAGRESFYERFGFVTRKEAGLGAGMILGFPD